MVAFGEEVIAVSAERSEGKLIPPAVQNQHRLVGRCDGSSVGTQLEWTRQFLLSYRQSLTQAEHHVEVIGSFNGSARLQYGSKRSPRKLGTSSPIPIISQKGLHT